MKRLIIRPGALGDFVVSIPALECLRAEYLEVWTAAGNVPLAARLASQARSITATGLDLLELDQAPPALVERLRSFDSIVSWYGAGRPEFRTAVGALNLPFHFFRAIPCEGGKTAAADFYLAQVRSLSACVSDGVPRIACDVARGGFAAIHPFAGSPRKRWPIERFRELARRLEPNMPVKWCAGPEDELPGAVRFENTYDLACWLASARIYIGNDSGPAHLAAAAGAPVVALFGPTDPAVWAPRGSLVKIAAAESMVDISIDQVWALVEAML